MPHSVRACVGSEGRSTGRVRKTRGRRAGSLVSCLRRGPSWAEKPERPGRAPGSGNKGKSPEEETGLQHAGKGCERKTGRSG